MRMIDADDLIKWLKECGEKAYLGDGVKYNTLGNVCIEVEHRANNTIAKLEQAFRAGYSSGLVHCPVDSAWEEWQHNKFAVKVPECIDCTARLVCVSTKLRGGSNCLEVQRLISNLTQKRNNI
jgi:hypothetical protein